MEPEHHLKNLPMHNAHVCYPQEKWPIVVWPSKGGSAQSLQQSSCRENTTHFLTFVAHGVRGRIFMKNKSPRGEM